MEKPVVPRGALDEEQQLTAAPLLDFCEESVREVQCYTTVGRGKLFFKNLKVRFLPDDYSCQQEMPTWDQDCLNRQIITACAQGFHLYEDDSLLLADAIWLISREREQHIVEVVVATLCARKTNIKTLTDPDRMRYYAVTRDIHDQHMKIVEGGESLPPLDLDDEALREQYRAALIEQELMLLETPTLEFLDSPDMTAEEQEKRRQDYLAEQEERLAAEELAAYEDAVKAAQDEADRLEAERQSPEEIARRARLKAEAKQAQEDARRALIRARLYAKMNAKRKEEGKEPIPIPGVVAASPAPPPPAVSMKSHSKPVVKPTDTPLTSGPTPSVWDRSGEPGSGRNPARISARTESSLLKMGFTKTGAVYGSDPSDDDKARIASQRLAADSKKSSFLNERMRTDRKTLIDLGYKMESRRTRNAREWRERQNREDNRRYREEDRESERERE